MKSFLTTLLAVGFMSGAVAFAESETAPSQAAPVAAPVAAPAAEAGKPTQANAKKKGHNNKKTMTK